MNFSRCLLVLGVLACSSSTNLAQSAKTAAGYQTVEFPAGDGLPITADLYQGASGPQAPMIVLCHQAGWSRGEYRETAPRLVEMGFNCLAIDQRSGKQTEGVSNETAKRATAAGKPTGFVAAEQDIIAALKYTKQNHAKGKLLLWGSSYSASFALRIAGEHPELVDGALAFSPGEYFGRFGQPSDWIARSATNITDPVFITSAKNEGGNWAAIYDAIPGDNKTGFLPTTRGKHGSRALWKRFGDSDAYWAAVTKFLKPLK